MDHNRQLLLTTLRAANSRLCLLAYVLSKQTSVTYISTVNIIEMGPGAVASCSEIRHDPKDESPPGGLSQRRLALQGESQVIYRKVEEHEERSGRGRGFEVWHLSIWECWRGGGTSNQAIIGYPHCYLGGAIPSRQQRHTKHSGGIRWPSLPSPGESKSLADTNLTS